MNDNTLRDTKPSVLVILPVINEVNNMETLLNGINSALSIHPYTICIIDDGSKDGTLEVVEKAIDNGYKIHLVKRIKKHLGSQRGSALLEGVRWGLLHKYEIFIEMDGDLSHRPEEMKTGIQKLMEDNYDVVIASKYMPGSKTINRPLGRRLFSRSCNFAVRFLIDKKIKDYSNGYRFYTRQCAQLLSQYKIKYGSPIYLTEVMAIWLKNGMRIEEFPTIYIGRNEGLSKLRLFDIMKAGIAVFEISLRYHVISFGKFNL